MASPLKHMDASRIPLKVRSRRIAGAIMRRLPVNPRRRGRPRAILFDAFNPMNLVCLRPMIDALQGRPDVRVRLTNSRERSLDNARALFTAAGYAAEQVPGLPACARAGRPGTCTCARTTRRPAAPGCGGERRASTRGTGLPGTVTSTATGGRCAAPAREHCRQVGCPDVPQLVGFPKLDRLVDGSLRRERILDALRLDPSRPPVMFASTWGPHSVAAAGFDEIATLLTAHDRYNVLLMLHQHCWEEPGDPWSARLRPYLTHPYVRLIQEPDCVPYLFVADALITDHSSIGYEFAVVDRPLFQFEYPNLIYSPPEQLTLSEQAAYRFRDSRELPALLDRGLRMPAELSAARRVLANACFYKPGNATQRAVETLLALASGHALPRH